VEGVTWFDAVEFCNKMSELYGLTPVYTIGNRQPATGNPIDGISGGAIVTTVTCNCNADGFRLPTEAEWEYACRAGTTTAYNIPRYNANDEIIGYGSNTITSDDANFDDWEMTTPGGMFFDPNEWGLYDMHGNVSEWVWANLGVYPTVPTRDPQPELPLGPGGNQYYSKGLRGGSWLDPVSYLRSAARDGNLPCYEVYVEEYQGEVYWYPILGFRVVCTGVPIPPSSSSPKLMAKRNAKMQMSKQQFQMKMQKKMQEGKIVPQHRHQGLQKRTLQSIPQRIIPQSIRVDKKLNSSPVKPQALRRKAFFE
jgi:formylglycine-generating enzyme required for sulfatase activity